MSLTASLSHALTGLRVNEAGLETVSRNTANAGVEGYVRRRTTPVEFARGGVMAADVQRVLDATVQRQLRTESGGLGYTSVASAYLQRIDASLGEPGGAGALDTLFNGLTSKLAALSAEPSSGPARSQAVAAAEALASGVNRLAGDVQDLRGDAETAIAERVGQANAALQTVERIERQLSSTPGGQGRADLLDERDRAIDALSKLADVRVSSRGGDAVSIFTSGGVALYDGQAATLTFEPRGALVAGEEGAGIGLTRGGGATQTLNSGLLRSGEIAALVALRDEILPALQQGLDSIAAGLSVAASEAGVTLFVDAGNGVATQPYAGGAQEVGYAARIAVDPAIAADPSALSPDGSATKPLALVESLTKTIRSFAAPLAAATGYAGDVGGAIRNLMDRTAAQSAEAQRLDEGQSVVVNALGERMAAVSGVSVDSEMAQLVEIQNAYAANARVMSVIQDMYDALLNI